MMVRAGHVPGPGAERGVAPEWITSERARQLTA